MDISYIINELGEDREPGGAVEELRLNPVEPSFATFAWLGCHRRPDIK